MIKVNGHTAGITVRGGSDAPSRLIELVEDNTTSGSSTFTIDEDGTYLLIVSNSLSGARSITLPQGRTATINQVVETTYGMTVCVADLQADDVVTLSASASSWAAYSKQIYKLTNISVSSVYSTQANNDGKYTFTVPTIGEYLVVGLCCGREEANYWEHIKETLSITSISCNVGVNTLTKIYADDGANIPELELYGFDGGGVFYIALLLN